MHEPPREPDTRPIVREPVPVHEDDLAATVGDIKGVRRWLLVTAAWALAATAIAVIALLAANKEDDDSDLGARTATQVGQVQKRLNARIDLLETRIEDLAPSEDLTSLDRRLRKVEQRAGKVSGSVDEAATAIEDLEARVETLEEEAAQPDPTPTETTETTPEEVP